jgi:hypothetical protein
MNDGTFKLIKDLSMGDVVSGNAKVLCKVIQRNCQTINVMNNLNITAWHPVKIHNKWVFPEYLTNSGKLVQDYVYNFVLDSVHTLTVNGTIACTLAHGFEGPVIGHMFFGTTKVHDSLKKFASYASGVVVIEHEYVKRDKDMHVCDYDPYEQTQAN